MKSMEIVPLGTPWPDTGYVDAALLAISEGLLEQRVAARLHRGIEDGQGDWAAIGLRLPSGALIELINYPGWPAEQAFIVRMVPTPTPEAVISELVSCLGLAQTSVIWRAGDAATGPSRRTADIHPPATMYCRSSIHDLPPDRRFLQDLARTSLTELDLSRKYGFVFEQTSDNISSCEVCVLTSRSGACFLIVCRNELAEWQVAIRTATSTEPIESYAPRMLADFIQATGFDADDIEHIWPFTRGPLTAVIPRRHNGPEQPRLGPGEYSVLLAERATGIILNLDGHRRLNGSADDWVLVFDSLAAAHDFARQQVARTPGIECSIQGEAGRHIETIVTDSAARPGPIDAPTQTRRSWLDLARRVIYKGSKSRR